MTGTDRIALRGLRVFGRHGVLPSERENGQEFLIDAVLWLDTRPAAGTDDLALTVDYGELATELARVAGGEPVLLIETLAERLAAICLASELVTRAQITVHKPAAPITVPFADVSVTITRPAADPPGADPPAADPPAAAAART